MDCCFSYAKSKPCFPLLPPGTHRRPITFRVVAAGVSGGRRVKCGFGASSAPLEPRSPAGKRLSSELLDDRDDFRAVARKELARLVVERDEAAGRSQLSRGSEEACLHRRIAELKKHECQVAVEDILYALILHEFYEIRVYLVPKLSKCICNGRLEIWPSKDWELESIHSVEVLEMVREHISAVIGIQANSCVKENWATTEIQLSCLCKLYAASILFGYFLKSASLRHHLEWGLELSKSDFRTGALSQLPVSLQQYIGIGHVAAQRSTPEGRAAPWRVERKSENLRCYVLGFDEETIQRCAEPKSKEAVNVIERHSCTLFGDEGSGSPEIIRTSYSSLKRLMLEAVAFGCFLWDAEKWLNEGYES